MAETDVLVVGSGPGGLAAALASAREGVDTMLVERYGCFGGNITQAQVESIAWYRHEGTVEAGGIGVEFERRAKEMGGTHRDYESLGEYLDADYFKYVADKMVQEAAIVPLLHCFAVDTIMEGNTIKGVITESKSGRQAILAKRVIDATGDADIAYHAGAPHRKASKQELMSVTVSFGCSGVDVERFLQYVEQLRPRLRDWARETSGKEDDLFSPYMDEPFRKAREAGEIPEDIWIEAFWHSLTEEGEAKHINAVRVLGIDPTDVWDLTRAEMEGRQHAMWCLEALRKYAPGFERAKLRTFGSSLGTRESRKIIGKYNITEQDVRNEARFEDSIGIFPEFLDAYGLVIIPTTGRYFHVPYGIILPKKVENLLVAGRCVAGDKISHAATRQMMCCTVTGQGAGVAAAVSLKENVECRGVDVSKVQKALERQGVRIR
ncbi:MAG: FAD-dependent oxidoreductase [Deltaproteobacteria bacterium]|nr:FAD-dependent oxidoreductase [Deltaproteobacteria bacterium]MBW2122235.1 FAD-dependent oxidoreductase [Deltaproteobacteria bacterium]